MFFYFLCALLLLNAITSDAQATQKCTDKAISTRAGLRFCEYMATSKDPKGQILCTAEGYDDVAKEYCAKTCGYCK
nr:Metridin ShK toxin domain containing protein [Haemonchus contortus]